MVPHFYSSFFVLVQHGQEDPQTALNNCWWFTDLEKFLSSSAESHKKSAMKTLNTAMPFLLCEAGLPTTLNYWF